MIVTAHQPGTPSWVDLGAPDPQAAAEFYAALLSWETSEPDAAAGGYRMATLKGHPVAGIGPRQQPDIPPYWTTYVTVASAEDTTELVRKAGGQVLVEPMDVMDFGRMAVFADPAGTPFSVWQAKAHIGAGVVNEPGALCWNELTTRDAERAKAFYHEVFGWEAETRDMDGVDYTEWKLDGRTIGGMMPMDDSWPADLPSHWMVYFAVADTDETAAKVTELGGTVSVPPTDIPVGRFAVLNDPGGAVFSVIAPNEAS
ncbi:VOC family protein [Amycolatopsis aidingensis]|uniref:VOC family protein n=1 Tax=Amycolatopsis aidingensis TaxID=2842453 RepID=UPI001C0CB6D3|nr:VOC family protein [Amycolatopsis aidingensis]